MHRIADKATYRRGVRRRERRGCIAAQRRAAPASRGDIRQSEDVLRAKTGLAEYYLANTDMQVREIAALCGFENDVHFMRQFRKRTGSTALEYRRRAKGQQRV